MSRNNAPESVSRKELVDPEFARAILAGLSCNPKSLPSKYLYDRKGDEIFQQIMELPEYYLSRCEEKILEMFKQNILQYFLKSRAAFNLIELGPGDGKKTRILIEYFNSAQAAFTYYPVDISRNALENLQADFSRTFPQLKIRPLAKDYFRALENISRSGNDKKLVLFLGGNIGNFSKVEAVNFLQLLSARLNPGDMLLVGFDLKKDPDLIHRAYDDEQGVTRTFNLNLLQRINRELDADFDITKFRHYPTYDPLSGEMKSYLIATEAHEVNLKLLHKSIAFTEWEPIYVEVSNKYSTAEISSATKRGGFKLLEAFTDPGENYVDALLVKEET